MIGMKVKGRILWKVEKEGLETIYQIEDFLRELGFKFDTGYDTISKKRHWDIDQEVEGLELNIDLDWQGLIFRADEVTDIFSEMMQIQAEVEPGMMELVINTAIQNIIAKRDLEILSDES